MATKNRKDYVCVKLAPFKDRAMLAAKKYGISLAAYCRLCIAEKLKKDQ